MKKLIISVKEIPILIGRRFKKISTFKHFRTQYTKLQLKFYFAWIVFKSFSAIASYNKPTEFPFLANSSLIETIQPQFMNNERYLRNERNVFTNQAIFTILEIPNGGSRFSPSVAKNSDNELIIDCKIQPTNSLKNCQKQNKTNHPMKRNSKHRTQSWQKAMYKSAFKNNIKLDCFNSNSYQQRKNWDSFLNELKNQLQPPGLSKPNPREIEQLIDRIINQKILGNEEDAIYETSSFSPPLTKQKTLKRKQIVYFQDFEREWEKEFTKKYMERFYADLEQKLTHDEWEKIKNEKKLKSDHRVVNFPTRQKYWNSFKEKPQFPMVAWLNLFEFDFNSDYEYAKMVIDFNQKIMSSLSFDESKLIIFHSKHPMK